VEVRETVRLRLEPLGGRDREVLEGFLGDFTDIVNWAVREGLARGLRSRREMLQNLYGEARERWPGLASYNITEAIRVASTLLKEAKGGKVPQLRKRVARMVSKPEHGVSAVKLSFSPDGVVATIRVGPGEWAKARLVGDGLAMDIARKMAAGRLAPGTVVLEEAEGGFVMTVSYARRIETEMVPVEVVEA